MKKLSFQKLKETHLPILFDWLNKPFLIGKYDEGYESLDELKAKYLKGEDVERFVVFEEGRPFGYIQCYPVDETHDYATYRRKEGETYGVDLFIGEESFLRRGYAFEMLKQFLAQAHQKIERVLVDPLVSNEAARALFQKHEFQEMGQRGDHLILGIDLRKAVRGLILDAKKRVLLIQMKSDPTKSDQKHLTSFWLTPGGKIEADESLETGLLREIKEEVGFSNVQIKEYLLDEERTAHWGNYPCRLYNRYFFVYSEETEVSRDFLIDYEKELIIGYKWWSLDELLETDEIIYPKWLSQKLEAYLKT